MRRGARTAVKILIVLLIAALIFDMYLLFQVRSINVVGGVSVDHAISLSGITKNQSVFLIDKEAAFERIDADTWIKMVEVKIKYPDQVVITAQQREIAAYVVKDDGLLAVDKECVLLEVVAKDEAALPQIFGMQMDKFEVGKQLGALDSFVLGVVQRVIAQLNESSLDVVHIDVSLAANIVLHTKQGIEIEIGDDTQLAAKFELATITLKELGQRGKSGGILDVSAVTSAYYREN